jgi:hypothetical protein
VSDPNKSDACIRHSKSRSSGAAHQREEAARDKRVSKTRPVTNRAFLLRATLFSESFVRCFSVEGAVWAIEVVEKFPLLELCFKVDIILVGQQLVELLLI